VTRDELEPSMLTPPVRHPVELATASVDSH
jgi:hypothetical protein